MTTHRPWNESPHWLQLIFESPRIGRRWPQIQLSPLYMPFVSSTLKFSPPDAPGSFTESWFLLKFSLNVSNISKIVNCIPICWLDCHRPGSCIFQDAHGRCDLHAKTACSLTRMCSGGTYKENQQYGASGDNVKPLFCRYEIHNRHRRKRPTTDRICWEARHSPNLCDEESFNE